MKPSENVNAQNLNQAQRAFLIDRLKTLLLRINKPLDLKKEHIDDVYPYKTNFQRWQETYLISTGKKLGADEGDPDWIDGFAHHISTLDT